MVFCRHLKEFDIVIDSQLIVLAAILKWCRRATKDQQVTKGRNKRIAFHTTNTEYFGNLQVLLRSFGYDLQDSVEVPHFEQARYQVKGFNPQTGEFSEPPAPIWVDTTIPHLIYHETSAESVVEMKHLLGAGLVDPALCCVLVDSFEEFELLEDMVEVSKLMRIGFNSAWSISQSLRLTGVCVCVDLCVL